MSPVSSSNSVPPCGVQPVQIGRFDRVTYRSKCLDLPQELSSKDVIRRVLRALKGAAFQACFVNWLKSLCDSAERIVAFTFSSAFPILSGAGHAGRAFEQLALWLITAWNRRATGVWM